MKFLSESSPNSLTWLFWVSCFFWYLLIMSRAVSRQQKNKIFIYSLRQEELVADITFFCTDTIPPDVYLYQQELSLSQDRNNWSKLRLNYEAPNGCLDLLKKLSVKRMWYLGCALQVINTCAGTCLALIWLVTSQCEVLILEIQLVRRKLLATLDWEYQEQCILFGKIFTVV